jgi:DNA-directed RNA polymerase beta subunit
MMAHNKYTNELKYNQNAKLFLKDDYVIEGLLGVHDHTRGSSVVELANPYNPIAELKSASKIIKTGPGGVPNKRRFKKAHRNIHTSYYGNVGANSTTKFWSFIQ